MYFRHHNIQNYVIKFEKYIPNTISCKYVSLGRSVSGPAEQFQNWMGKEIEFPPAIVSGMCIRAIQLRTVMHTHLGVIFSIVQNWPDHPPVQRNSSSPCPISTRGTDQGAFIYDVRCFLGISDIPTYPNQILYYISLCSKIRCSLTYLPT